MDPLEALRIRKKALHAAATVALALGPACTSPKTNDTADTQVADTDSGHDTDTDVADTDTDVADTDTDAKPDCVGDTAMTQCCNDLAAWCSERYDPTTATDAYNECVYGPNFDGSTGCIPWGPPVPPKMTSRTTSRSRAMA